MCLAQVHNVVMPVRLEPTALRSRFKHSTTEPEPLCYCNLFCFQDCNQAGTIGRSPFIMLCSGYLGMDHVISESCNNGTNIVFYKRIIGK